MTPTPDLPDLTDVTRLDARRYAALREAREVLSLRRGTAFEPAELLAISSWLLGEEPPLLIHYAGPSAEEVQDVVDRAVAAARSEAVESPAQREARELDEGSWPAALWVRVGVRSIASRAEIGDGVALYRDEAGGLVGVRIDAAIGVGRAVDLAPLLDLHQGLDRDDVDPEDEHQADDDETRERLRQALGLPVPETDEQRNGIDAAAASSYSPCARCGHPRYKHGTAEPHVCRERIRVGFGQPHELCMCSGFVTEEETLAEAVVEHDEEDDRG